MANDGCACGDTNISLSAIQKVSRKVQILAILVGKVSQSPDLIHCLLAVPRWFPPPRFHRLPPWRSIAPSASATPRFASRCAPALAQDWCAARPNPVFSVGRPSIWASYSEPPRTAERFLRTAGGDV